MLFDAPTLSTVPYFTNFGAAKLRSLSTQQYEPSILVSFHAQERSTSQTLILANFESRKLS